MQTGTHAVYETVGACGPDQCLLTVGMRQPSESGGGHEDRRADGKAEDAGPDVKLRYACE
jgi:hypothetical protein